MSPAQWQKARALFEAALAQPPTEREAFLKIVCADEPEVWAEVWNLLQAHEQAGSFLEKPVVEAATENDPTLPQSPPAFAPPSPPRDAQPTPSGVRHDGRFVAGTILAQRYRIISLLGQGGMGEVYKAEDLKLNQTVALKFLPAELALNGAMLARFHNEVRTARQITHPNVCRVHDIGEINGLHFISMEFIDGEDLSSLLKRIGRLPGDKAVEIARQICAGLSAAHENGVLHRDLKPANIMIDGRGKARITDFGIAVVAADLTGDEGIAGTPAYMAPEQLLGKEVTTKSDIYALGLVLYELFTGKRVYEARAIHELIQLHEKSTPPTPSSHVKDIDPLAERVTLRCLEKEPNKRPASAMQVALALPGGDPLQAAIAAGETPSPEMVAASGGETVVRPVVAMAVLVAIIIGLLIAAWLNGKVRLIHRVPFENPPEVLAHKAREICAHLGYANQPTDRVWDFIYNIDYLDYVRKQDLSLTRWDHLQAQAILFRYRESPQYFQTINDGLFTDASIGIHLPADHTGLVDLGLDPQGRLLWFNAVRPPLDAPTATLPNWSDLLNAAGIDPTAVTQTTPQRTPSTVFDSRIAWEGTTKAAPNIAIRVEAASWRGRPVYFQIIYPWTQEVRLELALTYSYLSPSEVIFPLITLLVSVIVVRWNYRSGRGDQKAALRLAGLIFFITFLAFILAVKTPPHLQGVSYNLLRSAASATIWAVSASLSYFAFEPYIRRHWPQTLISWSRIMTGRWRDALVGRDMLWGILSGIVVAMLSVSKSLYTDYLPEAWTGAWESLSPLLGAQLQGKTFMDNLGVAIRFAIQWLFILFFLRVLLRWQWLAALITILLIPIYFEQLEYISLLSLPSNIIYAAITVILMTRLGLVALIFNLFTSAVILSFPLSLQFSSWQASREIGAWLILLLLSIWGYHTSLGGQKLFPGRLIEE